MHVSPTSTATVVAAAVIAAAAMLMPERPPVQAQVAAAQAVAPPATAPTIGTSEAPRPQWAASATGRVEPRNGQIVISTTVPGRVMDVAVTANDTVKTGDLLARLEEDDLLTRVAAAMAEAEVRERERDEEVVKGPALERRQADDSVASAERALYRARLTFDDKAFRARTNAGVQASDVDRARFEVAAAREQLRNSRNNLMRVLAMTGLPLATRLESSLATARAELALAEAAVERARIRAPSDGTVLGVYVSYGEIAMPSPDAPLFLLGDLTTLRVKAEVEERDATKVRIGQRVVVRGDAFPDREFEGTVTSVSRSLTTPRIQPRGVRRPTDTEVVEVLVMLEGTPPLLSGMRVDVFFRADQTTAAPAVGATTTGGAGLVRADSAPAR